MLVKLSKNGKFEILNSWIIKIIYTISDWEHMNAKWGNLGKCGLKGTKGILAEFPARVPRLTLGLGGPICLRKL